jgi:hypothetical protein
LLNRIAQRIAPAVLGIADSGFRRALVHRLLRVRAALIADVVGGQQLAVARRGCLIAL